ncbi:MAG: ABC transporter ATP-binding protein [Defluviitaleaceae bacterium]|nr:ABC transporter ATP-binding protein [Defluviitaleaceae bacterium]
MIKIKNLSKNFGDFSALNNFCMNVEKGSIYGLVGVNGAGKTTVIKHLAGVLKGDAGDVSVNGADVYDNAEIKSQIGYVSDDLYFFPQYTLKALAVFYSRLYPSWSNERFGELVALMGLDVKRRVGRFSKGMQKQAALALSLAVTPKVLLLDEPIDGLDPIVRKKIFDRIIDDVADRQMTVLISSHNLKEMDGICDTVGIIKNGTMLIERELDALKDDMKNKFEHTPPSLDEIFIYVYENENENREVRNG